VKGEDDPVEEYINSPTHAILVCPVTDNVPESVSPDVEMEAKVCVLVHVFALDNNDEGAEYPLIADVDIELEGIDMVPEETVKPPLQVNNPEHVKVLESVSPVVDIEPNV
jgi:hypothetical protein